MESKQSKVKGSLWKGETEHAIFLRQKQNVLEGKKKMSIMAGINYK